MLEKANDTKAGNRKPARISITTGDALGKPVAVSRGNAVAEMLDKLMTGFFETIEIPVYPLGIETSLPMGVIKFRTVSYEEQSTTD